MLGYAADKPWVNRLLVYNLSLTIAGIGMFNKQPFIVCSTDACCSSGFLCLTFLIYFFPHGFSATVLVVVCNDFYTLAVYASVFGFTIGAYVGLTSVILVDLLGLDKLTNAFGLLLLFQGIASLAGPPIGGNKSSIILSY